MRDDCGRDGTLNTSGTCPEVPPEVRALGFCWPAFLFPMFWSISMNYPIGCFVGGLIGHLYLASKGYEIAWQYRRFDSMDHYLSTMRAWRNATALAAIVLLLAVIAAFGAQYAGGLH